MLQESAIDAQTPVPRPSTSRSLHIWLLQDGEPLPTDEDARLMRIGHLAPRLVDAGHTVTWWTSGFSHAQKQYRRNTGDFIALGERYRLRMLDGPSYSRNLSLRRMRHYRAISAEFTRLAESEPHPDLILGSLPSPELSCAGLGYARRHGVPFIVDIRDPWPDIFATYFPPAVRWTLAPIVAYYRRMTRAIMKSSDGIVAVSESMLDWGLAYAGRARRPSDTVFFIGYNKPSIQREITVPERFTVDTPLTCLFATTCGNSYDGVTVVDAARLLEANGERRVRFVLSGDGENRRKWMDRAAGLTTVQFTGWISQSELQKLFYTAHVGLILMRGGITPFWLGNKFAEYLSTSLALINNVDGEAAVMVDRYCLGLNVAARDPHAVAAAVRVLLDAPEAVRAAMHSSSELFDNVFDRRRLYDRYVQYLINAAAGPRTSPNS